MMAEGGWCELGEGAGVEISTECSGRRGRGSGRVATLLRRQRWMLQSALSRGRGDSVVIQTGPKHDVVQKCPESIGGTVCLYRTVG